MERSFSLEIQFRLAEYSRRDLCLGSNGYLGGVNGEISWKVVRLGVRIPSEAFLSVLRSQSALPEELRDAGRTRDEHGGRAIRNRTVLRFGLAVLSRGDPDSILLVPYEPTYAAWPTIIEKYDDCRLLPFTVVRFCLVPTALPSKCLPSFFPQLFHRSKRVQTNARFPRVIARFVASRDPIVAPERLNLSTIGNILRFRAVPTWNLAEDAARFHEQGSLYPSFQRILIFKSLRRNSF